MAHILIVEDTDTIGIALKVSLVDQGHSVRWCQDLTTARQAFKETHFDLILLDLGLPDGDGLDLCREIRNDGRITPIILVTARETLQARVEGLSIGADDYVTKPFELQELLARVDALIRRQRWHGPGDTANVGQLTVDLQRRLAWIDGDNAPMTELEFNLLKYFLEHPNQAVSREELLIRVWDQSPSVQTRTVDVFIGRLRRLIEPDPAKPEHLLNIRGVGYRLRIPQSGQPVES